MRFFNKIVAAIALCLPINYVSLSIHAEEKASFSQQLICKAAIGTLMGRDPSTMTITKVEDAVTYLHYIRKNDGSKWTYRCKIEGDRVIWASDTGRWRTDPQDESDTFTSSGNSLTIYEKYSDGSSTIKTFGLSQLGQ
ncbi:hypothetical protein [uncultured Desulfobulbus sp.]|uniref:hypothetical protein n=1 Tax=uncultured Desulfobulbus sp. TaxID=239745 RepID=UPI0029C750CD|nr:hypothetical protein [uncultured Desulfobulbus sp.]